MGDSHQSKEGSAIIYDRNIHKVEKVLDKITERTVEYRVKLAGIDDDECTWVPEKNLINDYYDLIDAYHKEARERTSVEVRREFENDMKKQKKKAKKGRKGKK